MKTIVVLLLGFALFSCCEDDDPYESFKVSTSTTFTMDSVDFRDDLSETYSLDIPIDYAQPVRDHVTGRVNNDLITVHLTKCYLTLTGTTGNEETYSFGFLNMVELFVEGMNQAESLTGSALTNRLIYGQGGANKYELALGDNIVSCAVTVVRSEDNPVYLPMTANCELFMEFSVIISNR